MLKKLINKTVANFPAHQNINAGEVGKLWMEHFGAKPDDLMETAINLVLSEVDYWPKIKDISNAIDALTADKSYNSAAFKQLDYNPKSRLTSGAVKEIIAMVKSGRAKEYLANIDIGPIREYIKDKFPDMSDFLIRQNYNELRFALEAAKMCGACMWSSGDCRTAGYYPVPHLAKEGHVRLEYAPCAKRRGKKI